jgi:hypothetical protein
MDPTETLAAFYQADLNFHRWRQRVTEQSASRWPNPPEQHLSHRHL